MRSFKGTSLAIVALFIILFVPFMALSAVRSEYSSQTLEDRALICITKVYPIDLTHYNITLDNNSTLEGGTRAIGYMLTSPDGCLRAHFLAKDDRFYQISLRVINGTVILDRVYDTLEDSAREFLTRYQIFSGFDFTDLIWFLDNYDETTTQINHNNITFEVSRMRLPLNGMMSEIVSYSWSITTNESDTGYCCISFTGNMFTDFYEQRYSGVT